MRPPAATPAQAAPRWSRFLQPDQHPRHSELVAAAATVAVLAHLLLAQLTLLLAAVFALTSRMSQWRVSWLTGPAGAGLIWTLAIGPGAAASGLAAGPWQILRYFAGATGSPGRILHPQRAFAGIGHWLPRQLPLALLLASAEAGLAWWLSRRRAAERVQARPGLIVAVRRRWSAALIRSGGVVTRDGGCLGVDAVTGKPATLSWLEAEGGVLCRTAAGSLRPAGPDEPLARACFQLAHAGLRRRKPVIVVDLTGSPWLPSWLQAACAGAGAPLRSFGPAGPGYYEPVRGGDPAQAAALVMTMIDWAGIPDQHRRTCAAYLADAFAVLAAGPAGPRVPVLADLAGLLTPGALRERLAAVPAHHPRRAALADRASAAASQAEADPAALAEAAAQLSALCSSGPGRWLSPGPARISLGQAVRDRAVVAFWLDHAADGRTARMIASLVAADLMAVGAELGRIQVAGDALVWIHGCEVLDERLLTELVARGAAAGIAVQLSTASPGGADRLAEAVNVLAVPGQGDQALAARFAAIAGRGADGSAAAGAAGAGGPGTTGATPDRMAGAGPAGFPGAGAAGGAARGPDWLPVKGGFTLLVKGPKPRLLAQCRAVPGGPPAGALDGGLPGTGLIGRAMAGAGLARAGSLASRLPGRPGGGRPASDFPANGFPASDRPASDRPGGGVPGGGVPGDGRGRQR